MSQEVQKLLCKRDDATLDKETAQSRTEWKTKFEVSLMERKSIIASHRITGADLHVNECISERVCVLVIE